MTCFSELYVALVVPISCVIEKDSRLQSHLFQLLTLISRPSPREAAALASLLVFVNVLFTTEAEMELIVKQSKAPTSFFFSRLKRRSVSFVFAAFIAALYIDKDLEYVHTFMNVCFFPRLKVSPY